MKRALFGFVVLGALVAGYAARTGASQGGREWPISSTEKLAMMGLQGRTEMLRQDIAKLASGEIAAMNSIAQVVVTYEAINKAIEQLVRDAAESRHAVAVVQSGTMWVERAR